MSDKSFPLLYLFLIIFFMASTHEIEAQQKLEKDVNHPLTILCNQLVYNLDGPKTAMIKSREPLKPSTVFTVIDVKTGQTVLTASTGLPQQVTDWHTEWWYQPIDFTALTKNGVFKLKLNTGALECESVEFQVQKNGLGKVVIPAITGFFYHQRACSPQELEADRAVKLFGSDKTVDIHGGWCDASGDISKYFSHLAYTNFMLPQQIPMVTWSMINTAEKLPDLLQSIGAYENLTNEALYGADYLMRSLSDEGYFYMTVFTYFNKDPKARRIVGLLADSKTTNEYQCAWREGGGMAIAALARISRWKKHGEYRSDQYLQAAIKAFDHLQLFSKNYADDGKDNIIDDYCALMGATELWITTGKNLYRDEARKRAIHLHQRLTPEGFFIANDEHRPFWHAADAGLPVMALVRFLDQETDQSYRQTALETIRKNIDYQLKVAAEVTNPFGYARQHFLYKGTLQSGFFIPHENESGWWWQGEDARLGSLAAAVITGGRLVYPGKGAYGVQERIALFAEQQVSWILGCNPYNMCMMYGYGKNNVPYMAAMYGHGSGKGGISNGITGKDGRADGSGIDFKVEDNGNEWRWSEQWIPHTGWFLQAVTVMSENK